MPGRPLVRDEARALVADRIGPDDRLLVTGATGWFGTTLLALLPDHPAERLHLVASRARTLHGAGRDLPVHEWGGEALAAFNPTIVVNFAFLTRDKEAALGPAAYQRVNEELSRRFDDAAVLPSVRAALTVSSGAALVTPEGVDLPIGSYGLSKRAEETRARALATAARAVVVARAWSLSGALVQRAGDYAFSDLVRQARTGRITVTAACEVWRRYCGVDDYLAVCLARALDGWSGVIDSGGPEVEMRALAALVAQRYPGVAPEVVSVPPSEPARRYCSDDRTWQEACAVLDFVPASLEQQVDDVQAVLA